ncbi:MAG TPA: prolyl oligopeptidase family serine peptidase [Steroidobacteraceae bacterium]|jgi:Dipeptidyl aminopeptidases/acylaminoacyl-peptidases|nr:prolyl oligopeptidase family serine peptidase [Steroidobacteraceae bacterium]
MLFARSFAAARAAACGLLLVAFGDPIARAAPLPIEDVLRAPVLASYSPPSLSPDNRFLAYAVVDSARVQRAEDPREVIESGVAWYAAGTDIWIADLTTGAHRNITDAKGHNWDASWSPDGEHLAFMADRSGAAALGPARLWLWERRTGTLRQVGDADVREGYTPMQWGDDHCVLVSLFPEELGRAGYVNRINPKSPTTAAAIAEGGPQVFEYDPARPDSAPVANQINSDMWLRDLALIDVRTGALRRLTRNQRIGHYFVAPDRQRIVYSVLQSEAKAGSGQYLFDVIVQELATGKTRILATRVPLTLLGIPFAWSASSDKVTWRSGGPGVSDEIYMASVRGGAASRIVRNPPIADLHRTIEATPAVWGPDGRHVYFIREDALWRAASDGSQAEAFAKSADRSLSLIAPRQLLFTPERPDRAVLLSMNQRTKQYGFVSVDLSTGASSQLVEETKRYGGYGADPTVSADGKHVVYVAEGPVDPPDVYMLDGAGAPRRLTNVAPALSHRALGKSEVLEWRSVDGQLQRGALIYPADYEAGKSYPLIVKVYGGSSISDQLNLFGYASAPVENLHLYTTRGYALLLADSRLDVGTPMVDLMKSVMPGIDRAIATGVADPQRIGITGHSYGGYSVLSLLVQSPRFKAAVMRAGMGDLIAGYGQLAHDGTNYGLAWAESGQGRMGGSPWDYRERYIENSPIFYLDRVQTPLLIIHGDQDDAVPVYLADEVFTGLRRLGKAVTYARYPGEGHWEGGWGYADRVDALQRQIAWFDRFLKNAGPDGAPVRPSH